MDGFFDGSAQARLTAHEARRREEAQRLTAADGVDDDAMEISDGNDGRDSDDFDSDEDWPVEEEEEDGPIDLLGEDDEDEGDATARTLRAVMAAREARAQRTTRDRLGFRAGDGNSRPGAADRGVGDDAFELPEGIDREEARMLEAAMLGVAYIPPETTTNYGPSAPAPAHVLDARNIADETNRAYEESLRADREKEAVARAEQLAKEMIEKEKAEEWARIEAEKDAEERARMKIAEEAAEAVPDEPEASTEGVVNIAFKMPDGSRIMRRFLSSHNAKSLFSFIDGYEKLHADGARLSVEPGSYRLVAQHPRRVVENTQTGTIADAGLTHKQEALMIDLYP